MNNKNKSLCIIFLLSIITTTTFVMSQRSESASSNSNAMSNNSSFIHGGGSGKITCADGSHPEANVAFIILSINGVAQGNWTLDDFNERANQGTFFTEGMIYNGSASLSQFSVFGNSDNAEEEIKLCNPHLQTPISITGSCGQNVAITVQLHPNNKTKTVDTFNGDVTCSSQ